MSQFTGNWIDSIGAIIPGYKGYKDKEMRRDTDKVLRNGIVKILNDKRPVLDRLIADSLKGRIELVDKLNQIKRKLDNAATLIRTAPAGYSGFFDTVQVNAGDLDRLYQFDKNLGDKATQVTGLIDGLGAAKDPAGAGAVTLQALQEFDELIRQRDQVIAEVR